MAGKKKSDGGDSLDVTVFVPKGEVTAGSIKKAALLAARDNIPVAAFNVALEIQTDPEPPEKTVDGKKGREYTVTIAYTPRRTSDPEGEHEQVTVEKVMASLEPLTPEKLEAATGGGATEA